MNLNLPFYRLIGINCNFIINGFCLTLFRYHYPSCITRGTAIDKTGKTSVLPTFGSYISKTLTFKWPSITLGLSWLKFMMEPVIEVSHNQVADLPRISKEYLVISPDCKDDSDYLAFKETTWLYSKFVYCSAFLCEPYCCVLSPFKFAIWR